MEFHSKRFQNARFPSPTDSPNFDSNPKPQASKSTILPAQHISTEETNKIPQKKENKPKSISQSHIIQLVYNFLKGYFSFLSPFYAPCVTCLLLIRGFLCDITCQNDAKWDTATPSSPARNNYCQEDTLISQLPKPSSSPSSLLYSSDSEDDFSCNYCGPDKLLNTKCAHSCENLRVDDYELPGVRFIDNVIYFINLYATNYPAFVQELSNTFSNWGCVSKQGSLKYKHNINPKEKRPKIIREGIEFLKRRRLKKKMSRVYGDKHKQWVLRVSLASRIIIFLMQLILVNLPQFFKHKNDAFQFTPEATYGKLLDRAVKFMFGGYINWDAHYFLHISVYGYTTENILAFFPLLPMSVHIPSRILYFFLSSIISLSSTVIVVGVLLNTWLFVKCTDNIYEISKFRTDASSQLITTACVMFCFNPSSIFFSGLYTETLFAYLTSSVILCLLRGQHGTSLIPAALSCLCRSNGILNIGFILALAFQNELRNITGYKILCFVARSLPKLGIAVTPFMLYQTYSVITICNTGEVFDDLAEVPVYCVPDKQWADVRSLPYSYIQNKYWNVGFLEYFQIKQIPNFILATPVLLVLGSESWKVLKLSHCRMLKDMNLQFAYDLFHALHGLFLTIFCFLFVHVQVSTRMIMAACPYLYIYLAALHEGEVERFRNREINMPVRSQGIILWFILYYIIGTIAFSRGLPWT